MQSRIYSVEDVRIESLIVIPENPPAIAVSALGTVATTGWTQPELAPWMYIVPPKDGILDLDFVATPPTGIALQVLSKIAVAKAFPVPTWVKGVRVHASHNAIERMLEPERSAKVASVAAEGWPLPWPFPWWAPKAKTA